MVDPCVNDLLLLGEGLDYKVLAPIAAAAGLVARIMAVPEALEQHLAAASASASAPAAALLAAGLPASERDRWTAVFRRGPALWASTPLVEWSASQPASDLLAALEERIGPLNRPDFRDPNSAVFRLVRLVGLSQGRRLLAGLADTLHQSLAEAATGPVHPAMAHRLAGLAGIYGFAELGRSWRAVETGESRDPAAALALTRQVLDHLAGPLAPGNSRLD